MRAGFFLLLVSSWGYRTAVVKRVTGGRGLPSSSVDVLLLMCVHDFAGCSAVANWSRCFLDFYVFCCFCLFCVALFCLLSHRSSVICLFVRRGIMSCFPCSGWYYLRDGNKLQSDSSVLSLLSPSRFFREREGVWGEVEGVVSFFVFCFFALFLFVLSFFARNSVSGSTRKHAVPSFAADRVRRRISTSDRISLRGDAASGAAGARVVLQRGNVHKRSRMFRHRCCAHRFSQVRSSRSPCRPSLSLSFFCVFLFSEQVEKPPGTRLSSFF